MTLSELLSRESFTSLVAVTCFWIIMYVIVRVLTARSGVDDLLSHADKRLARLRKTVLQYRYLCTAPGDSRDMAKAVKVLHELLKRQKSASKVLNMYLFDHKTNTDVAQAKAIVGGIPDMCRSALVAVAENTEDSLSDTFDRLDADIRQARELCSKARTRDRKNALLEI